MDCWILGVFILDVGISGLVEEEWFRGTGGGVAPAGPSLLTLRIRSLLRKQKLGRNVASCNQSESDGATASNIL